MGCMEPQGVLEQELEYLNALQEVNSYLLESDRLEMLDDSGDQLLQFAPLSGSQ